MIQGPYKLPEGWRWVRLGEVAKVYAGSSAPQDPMYFENGEWPFVRVSDLSSAEGNEIKSTRDYLNDKSLNLRLKRAPAGAIVFPKSGAAILTNARAILGVDAFIVSHLAAVEVDDMLAERLWIFRWLQTVDMREYIENPSYPSLRLGKIKEIPVPLPPLDEQRRIVGQIEEMMARVHEAKRLREEAMVEAERLWQSILTEIFPQLDSDLPFGWRWVRLGDVANKPQYGFTASSTFEQVGPRFLRITDIQGGVVSWENVPHCFCNEKTLKKYRLDNGDVLFARSGATTGKSYLVSNPPFEAVFASYLIRVKLKSHILDPEFAFLYFQSPYYWEQIKPRGAAQPNINASTLRKLLIPLPPIPKQRCIVAYLRAVQTNVKALREAQEATDKKLKRLEQTILDKAFRGEL